MHSAVELLEVKHRMHLGAFPGFFCMSLWLFVNSYWIAFLQFNSGLFVLRNTNRWKVALQKILSFYIIFRSWLLVVTVAEMYSKVSYEHY